MRDAPLTAWSRQRVAIAALLALALLGGSVVARATGDPQSEPAETTTATYSPSSEPETASSGSSSGGGGSVNNEVVIRNVTDGRFVHRAGSGIARVTGGDVENTNSAAAVSSCTDCRTVAVAVQAVLIMGDSDHIAPRNQAVAINSNCLRCESYALAYQYVVTTGGIVRFTSEGQQRIAELEAQIRALAGSETDDFLALEADIDALVEQIWAVVDEETVRVGLKPEGSAVKARDAAEDDTATASPTPTTDETTPSPADAPTTDASEAEQGPTPSPSPSPSESASGSPSEEPSPTPSDSPSPSPSDSGPP